MKKSFKVAKHNLSPEERKLTADNIAALVRLKKMNATLEQMHAFTGWSVSLCSKYTKNVKAEFATPLGNGADTPSMAQQSSPAQYTTAESQPPIIVENNSAGPPPQIQPDKPSPSLPRVSYEIVSPRHVILETNGAENNEQQEPHTSTSIINSNDPLEKLFAYSALTRGFTNVSDYVRDEILPDIRTLQIVKDAVPHQDRDSLERNFLGMVEDALTFRRIMKNSRSEIEKEKQENVEPN